MVVGEGAGLKNAPGSPFKTVQTVPQTGGELDYTKRGWNKKKRFIGSFYSPNPDSVGGLTENLN